MKEMKDTAPSPKPIKKNVVKGVKKHFVTGKKLAFPSIANAIVCKEELQQVSKMFPSEQQWGHVK